MKAMDQEEIKTIVAEEIAKMLDQQSKSLARITDLVLAHISSAATVETSDEAEQTRQALAKIKAKEFCTVSEAALLLGCSAQHLRNLVQKAIDGRAEYPIPYAGIDGPTVFPVVDLLAWLRAPKLPKKQSAKDKSHLKAVVK